VEDRKAKLKAGRLDHTLGRSQMPSTDDDGSDLEHVLDGSVRPDLSAITRKK